MNNFFTFTITKLKTKDGWLASWQAGRRSPHPGLGISGTLLNHPHTVQFYTNVGF
jgi:hypothetical protein